MPAYAYLRKSVVQDPSRMLSPEMQEAECRRLAAYDGNADDLVVETDLDISGTKDRTGRPGWDRVLTAIERGQCKDLYSYSMSRLARSVEQLAAIRRLCQTYGVGLHLVREKVDTSSASGRLYWNLQASFEEFWSDVTSERVRDAFATKRANDPTWDGPGQPAYGEREGEDADLVVEAFKAAGSWNGAARALNAAGVPTRVAGRLWSGSVVKDVVTRRAPALLPTRSVQGGRAAGPIRAFRFARLLECSVCIEAWDGDGQRPPFYLTASYDPRHDAVRYECTRGRVTDHPRRWLSESIVTPHLAAEASRIRLVTRRERKGTDDNAGAAALAGQRTRVWDMYQSGDIVKAEKDRRLALIAREEASLRSAKWVGRLRLPPDLATGDPARVNDYVLGLWDRVVVDMSEPARRGPSRWVPPLEFTWTDPSLRLSDQELQEADPA